MQIILNMLSTPKKMVPNSESRLISQNLKRPTKRTIKRRKKVDEKRINQKGGNRKEQTRGYTNVVAKL